MSEVSRRQGAEAAPRRQGAEAALISIAAVWGLTFVMVQ